MKKQILLIMMVLAAICVSAKPPTLEPQTAPSDLSSKERNATDILFYPYTFQPLTVHGKDAAIAYLEAAFGYYEEINGGIGMHHSDIFDFSYLGSDIGICYVDWFDNRHYFYFFFDTKAEADKFYDLAVADIKAIGIPLKPDKVYGGVSNRKKPIDQFKWVYVYTGTKVKPDQVCCNLFREEHVGKYVVEIGVYKR